MDYIFNGQAKGDVATRLAQHGFNPLSLRPYLSECGKYDCITSNTGRFDKEGKPVFESKIVGNATTTMRRDTWKEIDKAVVDVAKKRLKAVQLVTGAGLVHTIPNGMGKTVLETTTQSDITPADVSMSPRVKNANDRPVYELTHLPLPITHKDFSFDIRELEVSRNSNTPLDLTTARLSAKRVAEEIEKMLLGVSTSFDQYSFGGGKIYGYTDFPDRLTKVLTAPTASGWTGSTIVTETLAMIGQAKAAFHYGPYQMLVSTNWDQYLDEDYKALGQNTTRQRLSAISNISSVETVDYLNNFDIILVQMDEDVVRMVNGMDITTVAWDTEGGFVKNFKILAIIVPQLRSDQNGNTGLVHGSVA